MFTSTKSYLISNFKKLVLSPSLWSVITWAPKAKLFEKQWPRRKISGEKLSRKRKRRLEEHRHRRDHKEKWVGEKLSKKETEIQERCIKSWALLRNYLRWVKNYKEICVLFVWFNRTDFRLCQLNQWFVLFVRFFFHFWF